MSKTLIVSKNSSDMKVDYFPAIELDEGLWEIGLLNFETYHSLSNIDGNTPILQIYDETRKDVPVKSTMRPISIPTGFYEISDLQTIINEKISPDHINILVNETSLKCKLESNVSLQMCEQLKKILGFTNLDRIEKNKTYKSNTPVNVNSINIININCSIASGSYVNQNKSHIIHSFFPSVPHGYKIIEVPSNVIYHKLTTNLIESLIVRVEDQDGKLINFGEEIITIRLHLRKNT